MCLALPAEIVSLDGARDTAVVALGPVKKEISTALLEEVAVGDFVLVHVGFALHRLSPEEAARTLDLMREAGENPESELAGEAAP
jgi:hydrogenase expression/formation protein HypC